MMSSINIGHRYMLPVYPLLFMVGVDRLWDRIASRRGLALFVAAALLLGQAASCLCVAPHYLSYFNRFVGGPQRGRRYLVDSNVDWGQDLPSLRVELDRRGYRRAALHYFGTARPGAYGVDADPVINLPRPAHDYQAVAVSVTCLQGLYAHGEDPYRELRGITPCGRAGYSILIFDLSDPPTQAAFTLASGRLHPGSSRD